MSGQKKMSALFSFLSFAHISYPGNPKKDATNKDKTDQILSICPLKTAETDTNSVITGTGAERPRLQGIVTSAKKVEYGI